MKRNVLTSVQADSVSRCNAASWESERWKKKREREREMHSPRMQISWGLEGIVFNYCLLSRRCYRAAVLCPVLFPRGRTRQRVNTPSACLDTTKNPKITVCFPLSYCFLRGSQSAILFACRLYTLFRPLSQRL